MPLDVSRIRALCFDVDGTLSDTDDLWVARMERLLRPFSGLIGPQRLHAFARELVMRIESPGNLAYHFLDTLHLDDDAARMYGWLTRSRSHRRPRHFQMIAGVDEMLATLHPRYPLAVVSAGSEGAIHGFLEYFQFKPLFGAVATAFTCKHTKPYPDPVVWAAQAMGIPPAECLMIGDTTVDIRAGKSAGAQTVGVLCGFGTRAELERAGADLILSSTRDLPAALEAGQAPE